MLSLIVFSFLSFLYFQLCKDGKYFKLKYFFKKLHSCQHEVNFHKNSNSFIVQLHNLLSLVSNLDCHHKLRRELSVNNAWRQFRGQNRKENGDDLVPLGCRVNFYTWKCVTYRLNNMEAHFILPCSSCPSSQTQIIWNSFVYVPLIIITKVDSF